MWDNPVTPQPFVYIILFLSSRFQVSAVFVHVFVAQSILSVHMICLYLFETVLDFV